MEEDIQTRAQQLLDELNQVNTQEKAASALYRSTMVKEEKEAYEEHVKNLEARWNELYDQLQALELSWGFNGQKYILQPE